MRVATEERVIFYTRGGGVSLGPKSTGQDVQCKDEIWILEGANAPFILRHERDSPGIELSGRRM